MRPSTSRIFLLTSVAVTAIGTGTVAGPAFAAPSGGQITAGSASISQSGSKTDIHQNSGKVVLDWRSFDIGASEHVEFHQPSSSAMALNRIRDVKASQIDGKLTANGHVMLINPNGIVFGRGAQVDVGSLTATTADIDNDDFMAGRLDFKHAGLSDAAIINHGTISIKEAGLASFVAPRVENHGVIAARLGKVQLAAGDTFALDMAGDGLLQVRVTDEQAQKLALNTGRITAEGGTIALTAGKARNLFDSLVKNTGTIEAHSMTRQGGKVILSGSHTTVSGTVNANGKTGGGEILIGGDYQGKGDLQTAQMTDITETAQISADALDQGDGGKVIIWADQNTRFAGSITAHGGVNGGDGGFVETSGKQNLLIETGSSVNASALHHDGKAGDWLLDPSNVTITDGGANSIPGTGGTFDPTTDDYYIDAASISAALNNGNNVTITTTANGGADGEVGNITITNATIEKNVNNNDVTLTFYAHNDISISDSSITSSENALNLVLNADRDATEEGKISITNSTITTNGGFFVAGGGDGDLGGANGILGDGDGTGADDAFAYAVGSGHGINIANTNITTSNGDIILHGNAKGAGTDDGINFASSAISSGDGWISLTGISTGDGAINTPQGIGMSGSTPSSASITATGGNIDLYATSVYSQALYMWENSSITTDDGDISITANTPGGQIDFGANGTPPNSEISSTNGNVTFTLDEISLTGGTAHTIYAGDTLSFFTFTSGATIGLGGGSGTLNLNADELSSLNAGNKIVIGRDGVQTGDVDINAWDMTGKSYDVEIYGNDINMGGITMGTGSLLAHAQDNGGDTGDLRVDGNISRNADGVATLDIRADRNILLSGYNITANDANSDSDNDATTDADSLNIIFNSDRDADEDGRIEVYSSTINTLGGYVVMGGGNGDVGGANGILGDGDGTGADDAFAYAVGDWHGISVFNNTSITTSGGDAIFHGNAKGAGTESGFTLYTSTIDTGEGNISITGTSTGDTSNPKGIEISANDSVSSIIRTTEGDIDLIGNAANGHALYFWKDSQISTTDGNITIEASSSSSDDIAANIGSTHTISSINGNITFNMNDVRLDDFTSISAGDTLSIFTIDPTTTIGLGGGTGNLNLNTTELSILNAGNKIIIGEDGVQTGDIDLDAWNMSGTSFDLELYGNDLDLDNITMGEGSILAHAQDNGGDLGGLVLGNNVTRNANGIATLDLRADQDIYVISTTITASDNNSDGDNDASTDADPLNIILNADRDGDEDGRIFIDTSSISTNGGYFVAGGGNGDVGGANGILGDGDGTGADDSFAYANSGGSRGLHIEDSELTTSGGDIIMLGNAKGAGKDDGIAIVRAAMRSGNGDIRITGVSTGDIGGPRGIAINGTTTPVIIESTGGDIVLSATSENSRGLYLWDDTSIATVDGDITITATTPYGNDLETSGNGDETQTISSTNGSVTLNIDDIGIDTMTSISAGDTLSIFTIDPTTTIGLGGGAGTLNLSTTELAILNAGNKIIIGKDGVQTGDLDLNAWDISGTTFDLELYGNDINMGGITMGEGSILAHAQDNGGDEGDVRIDGNISRSANGSATLDLRADRNVILDDYNITANDANSDGDNNATTDADSLNIIFNSDRDADEKGRIEIRDSAINTLGGYFVAGGGSGDVGGANGILGDGDGTGADDAFAYTIGSGYAVSIYNTNITTSDGGAYIRGYAKGAGTSRGVFMSAIVNTGDGDISIKGISTGDTTYPRGVELAGVSSTMELRTTSGDIEIIGSATDDVGVIFWEDVTVATTDGDIKITATSSSNQGFRFGAPTESPTLSSTNGNITINTNSAYMDATASIYAGDTLSIFTIDPTTTIGLGGASGTLNLNTDELSILNAGNKIVIGKDGVQTGDIDLNAWNMSGKSFDLELYGNDINMGGITMGEGSILAHAQDNGGDTAILRIDGHITRTANGVATLDLRADQHITLSDYNITAYDSNSDGDNDANTDADSLNVILNADRDADEDGRIVIDTVNLTTLGGYVVVGGGSGDIGGVDGILGNGDGTGADDRFTYAVGSNDGISFYDSNIITSGGDVIMHGYAKGAGTDDGIEAIRSNINSGAGSVKLTGATTGDSGHEIGISLAGASGGPSTTLTTTTGDIDLIIPNSVSTGLHLANDVDVSTTDGDINITASADGNDIQDGGSLPVSLEITSTNGNITININDAVLDDITSIYAGDTLSIFTLDPTTTIGLGTGSTGILNLDNTELANLNAGNKIVIGKNGVQTGDMDIDAWDISSRSFDVELYANDITMGGIEMGAGSILAHAQDNGGDLGTLTIDGDIDRDMIDGTATLDLRADENILSSGGYNITATDADSDGDGDEETDADSLTVILNANRDGIVGNDEGGVDLDTVEITTLGGDIVIGGGTDPQNTPTYNEAGVVLSRVTLATSAGNIYITGTGDDNSVGGGDHGVTMNSSSVLYTTSGNITVNGTSRSNGINSRGIALGAVNFVTESGAITIIGEAQGNNTGNVGLYWGSDAGLNSVGTGTGIGDIILTGIGPGDQAEALTIEGTDDFVIRDANITITGINGDISIDNPISKVGGTEEITVTVQADGDITLGTDGSMTSSSGIMNVVLNSDRDADEDGDIFIDDADITTNGGYFIAGGGSGTLGGADGILGNGDGTGADDSYAYGAYDAIVVRDAAITTSGGDIIMRGYAKGVGSDDGIMLSRVTLSSGDGSINLTGVATETAGSARGLEINAGSGISTNITSTGGNINITGSNANTGAIRFSSATDSINITTTDGDITITTPSTSNGGIESGGATTSSTISSANGNVTLTTDDASLDIFGTISAGDTLSIQTASNNTSIGLGNGAAGILNLNAAELAVLSAGNRIVIGDSNNTGAVHVNNADLTGETLALYGGAMTIDGGLDADALSLISKGNITLNGAVTATDTGNSIIMKGTGFANTAGANAIDAGAGRYLVYMDTPSSVSKGGLTAKNLYNRTYSGHPPSSIAPSWGDRFVFAYQPTLTFTPNNQSLNTYNPSYNTFPYTVSGMVPGDSLADIFSGLPSFSKQETQSGTYRINGTNGSLTSLLGYKFAFAPGTLHMPRPVQQIGSSAGQQLQAPDRWLTQHSGYKIEYTNTASTQNTDTSQVTVRRNNLQQNIAKSAEQHADVRLVEADFMEINQPVIDFYDLCSYNVAYCQ